MKTDLRRELNELEENFDIDEMTIYDGPEIDPEKIRRTVMQNIKAEKPRNIRKKVTICLIAAALATAVIGSTVLAATGVFKPKLSDVYKGDTSFLEIQDTEEFTFTSYNDDISAEFMGIVSTEDETIASVLLTKKDGTAFTEAEDIEVDENKLADDIIDIDWDSDTKDFAERLKANPKNIDYAYAFYKDNNEGKLLELSNMALTYVLSEDKKSIRLYVVTSPVSPDEPEVYINVVSRDAEAFHFKEKVNSYDLNDGNDGPSLIQDYIRLYGSDEKKYRIKESKNVVSVYSTKTEKLSLPYYLRIKLDYTPESQDLTLRTKVSSETAPHVMKKDLSAEMTITPTRILLETENNYTIDQINEMQSVGGYFNEEDKYTIENPEINFPFRVSAFVDNFFGGENAWTEFDDQRTKIVMTDGTVYYLTATSSMGCDYDPESDMCSLIEEKEFYYSTYPDFSRPSIINVTTGIYKKTIINPNDIAKFVLNGDTVYTKKGYEDLVVSVPGNNIIAEPSTVVPEESESPVLSGLNFNAIVELRETIKNKYSSSGVELSEMMSASMDEKTENSSVSKMVIEICLNGKKDDLKAMITDLAEETKSMYLFITEMKLVKSEESSDYSLMLKMENPHMAENADISEEELMDYINTKYASIDIDKMIENTFN